MSISKAQIEKVAAPYAVAFLETAQEKKLLKKVATDVADIKAMISDSADFQKFLQSPLITSENKVGVVQAIGKKAKLQDITTNFLCVLARNNRLPFLNQMLDVLETHIDRIEGNMTAEVVSASALTTKQTEDLKKSLKKALGSDVVVQAEVNEELLGGMIVKVGSRMIDDSVKTKLDRLSRNLTDTTGYETKVKQA